MSASKGWLYSQPTISPDDGPPIAKRRSTRGRCRIARLAHREDVGPVHYHLVFDDVPRRPLRAPENALGDRLAAINELDDDALNGVIDGLLTRTRRSTLTGGLN